MTIPADLLARLIPSAWPLGLAPRTPRAAIALPAWMTDPLPARDGEVNGRTSIDGEFAYTTGACVRLQAGKVSRLALDVDVPDLAALAPAFDQVVAALASHGKPELARDPARGKYVATWALADAELRVAATATSTDGSFRVTVAYEVTGGAARIDIAAWAAACATDAYPVDVCLATFTELFAGSSALDASDQTRATALAIYEAAGPAVQPRLIALCDWSALDDRDGDGVRFALWGAASGPGQTGRVMKLAASDLVALVRLCRADPWKVVVALEHGDAAACAELERAVAKGASARRLELADPAQYARTFAIATGGLSNDERVMWPIWSEGERAYGAAAAWLWARAGKAPPVAQSDYGAYLVAVKACARPLLVTCIDKLVERHAYASPEAVRDACALVADSRTGDQMKIGPLVLAYKPGTKTRRGTFKLKRARA